MSAPKALGAIPNFLIEYLPANSNPLFNNNLLSNFVVFLKWFRLIHFNLDTYYEYCVESLRLLSEVINLVLRLPSSYLELKSL